MVALEVVQVLEEEEEVVVDLDNRLVVALEVVQRNLQGDLAVVQVLEVEADLEVGLAHHQEAAWAVLAV